MIRALDVWTPTSILHFRISASIGYRLTMPRGVLLVALLTPFTPQGDIDTEALQSHEGHLRADGVDGFFVSGTTGEGPLLDDEEVLLTTRPVLPAPGNGATVIT